jgi:cell division protein FtsN
MKSNSQRGGTFLGLIMGLVIGLGLSLAVAIYVTKVPTPFSNKNQPRSSEQDNAEIQKNKDWNPNSVLQPKPPAETPTDPASDTLGKPLDKPAEVIKAEPPTKPELQPAVTADPLGDLAKSKAGLSTPAPTAAVSGSTADPFEYVIQVGAFRASTDADAQKAKIALMGLDAKVSERDQGGRSVYRVRLGPFPDKAAAEKVRIRLEGSGIENTLVRVQR